MGRSNRHPRVCGLDGGWGRSPITSLWRVCGCGRYAGYRPCMRYRRALLIPRRGELQPRLAAAGTHCWGDGFGPDRRGCRRVPRCIGRCPGESQCLSDTLSRAACSDGPRRRKPLVGQGTGARFCTLVRVARQGHGRSGRDAGVRLAARKGMDLVRSSRSRPGCGAGSVERRRDFLRVRACRCPLGSVGSYCR